MMAPTAAVRPATAGAMPGTAPISSLGYDWVMVVLSAWFLSGLYLDGRVHLHTPAAESFVTPWHGVLYSGVVAVAGFLLLTLRHHHAQGYPWRRALPAGYEGSGLGVVLFLAGGMGDALWHHLFGLEAGIAALLSPTHLVLALAGTLIVQGPFRAAWRRVPASAAWRGMAQVPMLVSLAFTLSLLTFITVFAHPLVYPWAAAVYRPSAALFGPVSGKGLAIIAFRQQAGGVSGLVLHTMLVTGLVLVVVRRWGGALLPGGMTVIFGLNAAALGVMSAHYQGLLVAGLVGLSADLWCAVLKPSTRRPRAFRLFAFGVPASFCLWYFLALWVSVGLWWSVHLWLGSSVLAGMGGWLLSYLLLPPPLPAPIGGEAGGAARP